MLSRRAPLLGVVFGTQLVGMLAALAIGIARGEPIPQGVGRRCGRCSPACSASSGITSLYRGLAVGRMGVVAPTTGVLAAVVPVVVGFATEGLPSAEVDRRHRARAARRGPGHAGARPRRLGAIGASNGVCSAASAIGLFNVCIGQLSGAGTFGPLVLVRLVQAAILLVVIVVGRQAWRMPLPAVRWVVVVGLLDMSRQRRVHPRRPGRARSRSRRRCPSLYPVGTVILAIAVLHERLTRSHAAGIALTAVAIVLIGVGSAARSASPDRDRGRLACRS